MSSAWHVAIALLDCARLHRESRGQAYRALSVVPIETLQQIRVRLHHLREVPTFAERARELDLYLEHYKLAKCCGGEAA